MNLRLLLKKVLGETTCLKFKDRINRILCKRDMYFAYRLTADLSQIVREFEAQAETLGHSDVHFFANYIVSLLASNKRGKARDVLQRLLSMEGGPEQVARYYKLSEFAMDERLKMNGIDRVVEVGRRFFTCHNEHPFERFVSGKTVALIGNGPSEVGKGLGDEIDAHDIVIRINNYVIKGHEADYGNRTDIWAKRTDHIQDHHIRDERIKLVIYESDFNRIPFLDGYLDAIESDMNRGEVDYCAQEDKQDYMDAVLAYPTTGAQICEKLRKSNALAVDLYGFSFLTQDKVTNQSFTHYGNDISPEDLLKGLNNSHHRVDREAEYLRRFFPNGRRLETV